jgi:hypothetical protein
MKEDNKDSSLDILGVKPIGEAANKVVDTSLKGIEGFLKTVCVPALEEFGLLLKDKVRNWRLNNISKILGKAKGKLEFENENLQFKAHPRVALSIIDNGSLNDNDEIQEMWAGLFVSSCTKDGQDDENLIFIDLLKQLTVCEARILKYACENSRKILYPNGLVLGDHLEIPCEKLIDISSVSEVHRLDRELDHLRSLQLIGSGGGFGGFDVENNNLDADITPSALGLNLYLKANGFNGDPKNYWQHNIITNEEFNKEAILKEKKEKEETETRRKELNNKAWEKIISNQKVENK